MANPGDCNFRRMPLSKSQAPCRILDRLYGRQYLSTSSPTSQHSYTSPSFFFLLFPVVSRWLPWTTIPTMPSFTTCISRCAVLGCRLVHLTHVFEIRHREKRGFGPRRNKLQQASAFAQKWAISEFSRITMPCWSRLRRQSGC